jgi:hypothetical protein
MVSIDTNLRNLQFSNGASILDDQHLVLFPMSPSTQRCKNFRLTLSGSTLALISLPALHNIVLSMLSTSSITT